MPIAFLIVGAAILVAAIRNTHKELGSMLLEDLRGSSGFVVWIASIAILGMIGYIPGWEKPSRAFLGLIVLSMFLANGGFFDKFKSALTSPETVKAQEEPKLQGPAPVQITGAGGSDILGSVTKLATTAATLIG